MPTLAGGECTELGGAIRGMQSVASGREPARIGVDDQPSQALPSPLSEEGRGGRMLHVCKRCLAEGIGFHCKVELVESSLAGILSPAVFH